MSIHLCCLLRQEHFQRGRKQTQFHQGGIYSKSRRNQSRPENKSYLSLDLFLWLYFNTKQGRRIVKPCYYMPSCERGYMKRDRCFDWLPERARRPIFPARDYPFWSRERRKSAWSGLTKFVSFWRCQRWRSDSRGVIVLQTQLCFFPGYRNKQGILDSHSCDFFAV